MVHGFQGEPNGGWRPWLMGELAQNDIWACALAMPNPNTPSKEEWVKTINDAVINPSDEIFLVGHSLGVPAILRYLETLDLNSQIGGAVLVSGPVFKKDGGNEYVTSFINTPFDFYHIKDVCKNFVVIHGDNDPNVSFDDATYISEQLSCDLISIPNGGHLAGYNGWFKLPEALNFLLKIIK